MFSQGAYFISIVEPNCCLLFLTKKKKIRYSNYYFERNFTMKIVLAISALLATTVVGFAPLQIPPSRQSSTNNMASTMQADFTRILSPPSDYNVPNLDRHVPLPPMASEASLAHKERKGDVIIDPDFKWATALLAMGPAMLMMYPSEIGVGASVFHLVLAAFLGSQTNRVRLVFGKDGFELYNLSNSGEYLKEKPSNYVAGTVNRWKYDDIVDYGFYPSIHNPFIVYFKETATAKTQTGNFGWWGKLASNIYMGNKKLEGQPHFMPGLFDTKEFVAQMENRGVKASTSIVQKQKQAPFLSGLAAWKERIVQMGYSGPKKTSTKINYYKSPSGWRIVSPSEQ